MQVLLVLLAAVPIYAQAGPEIQQIESAESAVRHAPDSETARVALGTLYLKLGQNRRASDTLAAYLKVHPASTKTLRLLAAAALRQEDYSAAKDYAARARRLEPRDAAGVHLLAMACLGLQDAAGAESLFREALALDPDSVDTNFQLGLLYTRQHERLAEAIRLLEKAEARQPDLAGTHTALGSALLQSGRPREAARQLEVAVTLDPHSAESYYILADAYRRLGESEKAKSALAEFNTRNAGSADDRAREMRSRSFYEEGTNLLANTDRLDAAYDALRKAAQAKPDFDAAYYRMAQVRYLQGDPAQAVTHIREALRLNALEPEYYFVLAKCLETTDHPGALSAIQTAVKLRPGVPDFEELLRSLENKRPE